MYLLGRNLIFSILTLRDPMEDNLHNLAVRVRPSD